MVNILKNNPSDFEDIKEWDYEENFYILKTEYGDLRIHYVDEGSNTDKTVLLLHGEPDWGYIYRKFKFGMNVYFYLFELSYNKLYLEISIVWKNSAVFHLLAVAIYFFEMLKFYSVSWAIFKEYPLN